MSVHESSHQAKGGWRTASLNELGQLYCGQSPATNTLNTNGLGTLYVSGPEQWDGHKIRQDKWTNDPKRLVPDGCIFITVKGAGVGKIFPGISCAIGRDVYAFKPKAELSAKFIEHAIRFTVQDVLRHAVGDIPGLSKAHILQHEIGIPDPQEQEHIVAEIEKQFSRLDEANANLKRVKANLKRYKASVLKAAVEGKLTEDWRKQHPNVEPASKLLERILAERRAKWKGRGEYKQPAELGTTNLPKLPKGWVWTTIAWIADVASGNTPSGVLGVVRQVGEIPWFKVGDMNHDENQQVMRHADAWLSVAEVRGLGLRLFQPNTVLFPKRGGAIATNKKRRLESLGCADLNVMGITPDHNIASYFFTWFDGLDLGRLSDGSNVPQINHKDIEPLAVPLPPLAEQRAIVAEVERHLSVIDELEATVEANLTRADRLRQAILSQAFSGQLQC